MDSFIPENPGSTLQADIDLLNQRVVKIRHEIGKVVIGQDKIIELILAGIFTGGHILLEGVPALPRRSPRSS